MTFLNPAFLGALPLLLVPIAIHLLRRRRKEVIRWGAMQFLQAATTQRRRTQRLEEWLLLLLRVTLIAVLVFALARTQLSFATNGQIGQEFVIMVDNSLSTHATRTTRAWDRIVERVEQTIDRMSSNDRVWLRPLVASRSSSHAAPGTLDRRGKAELLEDLHALQPTLGAVSIRSELDRHLGSALSEDSDRRQVIVFTDGQASAWLPSTRTSGEEIHDQRRSAVSRSAHSGSVRIVDCGVDEPVTNLAVHSVRLTPSLPTISQRIHVSAVIVNGGSLASDRTMCEWRTDDEVKAVVPVPALAPGQHVTVDATWELGDQPAQPMISATVRVSDNLPQDDQEAVITEVREWRRVLFIESEYASAERLNEFSIFSAALGISEGKEMRGSGAGFLPVAVLPSEITTVSLESYDIVVWNDFQQIEPEAEQRLTRFVRNGGGLWLIPGRHSRPAEFADVLSEAGWCDAALDQVVTCNVQDTSDAGNDPAGRFHVGEDLPEPLRTLRDVERLDLHEVLIRRRFRFADSDSGALPSSKTLLAAGNGDPLLIVTRLGAGRVITQAVPLNPDWSTLPLSKSFVVLVRNLVHYLDEPSSSPWTLQPGQPFTLRLPETRRTRTSIVTPDGRTRLAAMRPDEAAVQVSFADTILPGVYQVVTGDATYGTGATDEAFLVQRPPAESLLRRLTDSERSALERHGEYDWAPEPTELPRTASLTTAPQATGIWGKLLSILLICLVLETMLANRQVRSRTFTG